jgi:dTDP-4-amino-4,6-dideoxygalactose transaminase
MNNTMIPFLDLKALHDPLQEEFQRGFAEVIESNAFAGGRFVEKFEQEFAEFCACKHAIGVGSGTDALWLAMLALDIGPGDEVITVSASFMATAEAITYCGAKPVFIEMDPLTYTMDPTKIEAAITPRTKAIVPVHLYGQMADMDPIMAIAQQHNLRVIEDSAQGHGAKYKGRTAGSIGDVGCFSFYPGKNLGALGEAGAATTQDAALAARIRMFRDHGQSKKYHHAVVGWNGRMDGLQGVALSIKLRHLAAGNAARREIAAIYDRELAGQSGIVTPTVAPERESVFHLYVVLVADRDRVLETMQERGVACGIHYPIPIHRQEAYASLGMEVGSLPLTEDQAIRALSLPMFPTLGETRALRVAETLKSVVHDLQPAAATG